MTGSECRLVTRARVSAYLASGLRDTTFGAGGVRRHAVPFPAGSANSARHMIM